jgi:hypothetical protein
MTLVPAENIILWDFSRRDGRMLDFLRLFANVLAGPFSAQVQPKAEILVPRRQLNVFVDRLPRGSG